jgi:DNA polymerase-3 subunit alpha
MILEMDKEWGGMYCSGHPLDDYREVVNSERFTRIADVIMGEVGDGEFVTVAGLVTSRRDKRTKNNTMMSFIVLEDFTGSIETIVFPKTLTKHDSILKEGAFVRMSARIDAKDDDFEGDAEKAVTAKLIMDAVSPLEMPGNQPSGETKTLRIRVKNEDLPKLDDIRRILMGCKGFDKVVLNVEGKEVACHSSVKTNAAKAKELIDKYFGEERCEMN